MRLVILCCLLASLSLRGQLVENFSDPDLTDGPVWSGDIDHFVVNTDQQLQLMAAGPGKSTLFTPIDLPDSFSLSLDFHMLFSPSASNFLTLYLGLDRTDVASANGLIVRMGENGSNDALRFIQLTNGSETEIFTASLGSLANDPSKGKIILENRIGDELSLRVDYGLDGQFMEEGSWTFSFPDRENLFFGFACTYTSTRTDKFVFDNIALIEYSPDIQPPEVVNVAVQDGFTLHVFFNEAVDPTSIFPLNFNVTPNIGMALTAIRSAASASIVELTFDVEFDGATDYILEVEGIRDIPGNQMEKGQYPFVFADFPVPGDIRISEILFDPFPDGSDFVELYNATDKRLRLSGSKIGNTKNTGFSLLPDLVFPPKSYLAFTENKTQLIEVYQPEQPDNIVEVDLPAFNNDSGNVYFEANGQKTDESFDYFDDYHHSFLDNTEGVSLERISFDVSAAEVQNWSSGSAESNYATPGYANANEINIEANDDFVLESSRFSPNMDGHEDEMILIYQQTESGGILNLSVFDSQGFEVKRLRQGLILGTEGIIRWDGRDNKDGLLRKGIYVLQGTVTFLNGKQQSIKLAVSLI